MTSATQPNLRLEWRDPAELNDNPANWRKHPAEQINALEGLVSQVGWAGALLFNEATGRLIDGHGRKELYAGKAKVPVLVGSWTEEQEKLILATLDPIGGLAEMDEAKFQALRAEIETSNDAIKGLLDGLQMDAVEQAVQEATDTSAEPRDFTGSRNAIISYTIIFDNEAQQTTWFQFLRTVKAGNPDSIAAGITQFIQEHAS